MYALRRLLPVFSVVFLVILLSSFILQSGSASDRVDWTAKIDPYLLDESSDETVEFLVFLYEQADLSPAKDLKTKNEKGQFVYETLSRLAEETQGPLLAQLSRMGVEHRAYWVVNMVWARGNREQLEVIARRSDVEHIYNNPTIKLDVPETVASMSVPAAVDGIEWNIAHVNAPTVWAAGYTGQGVVVAGQDTGYQWDHPALINQYRGWNGATANHDYNWYDAIHTDDYPNQPHECGFDTVEPCDDNGHGTHTMGTIVGSDGIVHQIGMAPGAKWIGCRNMEDGNGKPSTYIECFEWFIAPTRIDGSEPRPDLAPAVINNSWSCPPSEGCVDLKILHLHSAVEAVTAAGILTANSAGNSGPGCETVNTPPAIYPESFTVGAIDNTDLIASFSSRGPVNNDDGNVLLKPNVTAPGVGIKSATLKGGYLLKSGTSMAVPHVAGLVALLISADETLLGQVDVITDVIQASAVPQTSTNNCEIAPGDIYYGDDIPNIHYGWGRIDGLSAFNSIPHDYSFQITKAAISPTVYIGDHLTYTLSITHTHPLSMTTNVFLTDTIPTGTTLVDATSPFTLTGSILIWNLGNFDPKESREISLTVKVDETAGDFIINSEYGVSSDDVSGVTGDGVSTLVYPSDFVPGVALSPLENLAVSPNQFILQNKITNTGSYTDQFNLIITDTQGWGFSTSSPITLGAGEVSPITYSVNIPGSTPGGTINEIALTAISSADPETSASVMDIITSTWKTLLSLLYKP